MKSFKTITLLSLLFLSGILSQAQPAWEYQYSTGVLGLRSVDFCTPDLGMVVGPMGTVLKTTDGGQNWVDIYEGNEFFTDVLFLDDMEILLIGFGGIILKSYDGGEMWITIQEAGQPYNLESISIDTESGNGIIAGSGNLILWTENSGDTWTEVQGGYMNTFYGSCMAGSDFAIVCGDNAVFQPLLGFTFDGGETWDGQPFYPTQNNVGYEGKAYDAHFFDVHDGYIVGAIFDGTGFITSDIQWEGDMWEAEFFPQYIKSICFDGLDHGAVAGGSTFIAESFDGGVTWEEAQVNSKFKDPFNKVVLIGNTGYAVTDGGDIYKKTIQTGIEDAMEQPVEHFYSFPNPASENSTIFLELKEDQQLSLNIYNYHGQLVASIAQGLVPAGKHHFNVSLKGFASGMYSCRLVVDQQYFCQKLMIE